MAFLQEFKAFAMRGNVVDLAVGVIIGAAFGAVVNSLVNDILMPPIGKLTGGLDFKEHFIPLNGGYYATIEEAKKATAVIAYGTFINTIINFLIIAFAIFLVIRQLNRLFPPPAPAPPPGPSAEVKVLTEIRDLLADRQSVE
jgi:large conductance mechanosensitive channel